MNNLTRFKLKMLTVLTFCILMTFSMLVYVVKLTEKCNDFADETCVRVSKNPVFKAAYVFYNVRGGGTTVLTNEIAKPVLSSSLQRSRRENSQFGYYRATPIKLSAGKTEESSKAPIETEGVKRRGKDVSGGQAGTDGIENELSEGHPWKRSNFSFEVYEKRRSNLRRVCQKYFDPNRIVGRKRKIRLNHILIDEKEKILYCYVPKVACTNWKRIFLLLTGKATNVSEVINLPASKVHAKNLFKSLQNYSIPEAVKMTEDYTKFIFVRHPFERLLSAYRNKLEQHYDSSKYFQARFGKYIIRNYRKNPTNLSLARGDDVTFSEFADYIVSSNPNFYNEHWQRVTDLCHPCQIKYDFIGKYDSLMEDSNFLLRSFGKDFQFPLLAKPSTTSSNLKRYYNTLKRSTIYKLYRIYEMDFRLFGYDLSNTSDWFDES